MQRACCALDVAQPDFVASALRLVPVEEAQRPSLERFVSERYRVEHDARVFHFLPNLLALIDSGGQLLGAVGYHSARDDQLFLEQYLDEPIEDVLRRRAGVWLARESIVEVGNLAAVTPGAARAMVRTVTAYLFEQGYSWVVFTATGALRNTFRRLGLLPLWLAAADPDRLGDDAALWGRYYTQSPQVVAGSIELGYRLLRDTGLR